MNKHTKPTHSMSALSIILGVIIGFAFVVLIAFAIVRFGQRAPSARAATPEEISKALGNVRQRNENFLEKQKEIERKQK